MQDSVWYHLLQPERSIQRVFGSSGILQTHFIYWLYSRFCSPSQFSVWKLAFSQNSSTDGDAFSFEQWPRDSPNASVVANAIAKRPQWYPLPASEHSWIAGGLLVILYEELQQSVLSHESLLWDTCCHIHDCTSGWEVPIVEMISQCPLPLWMTWMNSDGSMSKFIVKPQHTLCRPESAGKACFRSLWTAFMILSLSNPAGLSRISLSLRAD